MELKGVLVANPTFFNADLSLDLGALKDHVQSLIQAGVHGLVPCGTTGESPVLTSQERHEVIRTCVEWARPKGLKVIAGCGSYSTQTVVDLIHHSTDLGADAALVVTPYYNKPTQSGLLAHYQHIADRAKIPIVLYHVPGRTGVSFTVDTVEKLWQHPRIIGIKEASGNYAFWLSLAQGLDLKKKSLLAGDDDAFATIMALGGAGIISATANVYPSAFVKIYDLACQGKLKEAFQEQLKIVGLIRAMFLESNPAPVKMALSLIRQSSSQLRLPLVEVSQETRLVIETQLRQLELLI